MMNGRTIGADYFEQLYRDDPDPWQFETSEYERTKYSATIAALAGRRYRSCFEVGCANGVLTGRLSQQCDTLLAVDIVPDVVDRARMRCKDLVAVTIQTMAVPHELPKQTFDLIVLSEVGYYWSEKDLRRFFDFARDSVEQDGDLLLVHWTGPTNYPQTADDVHSMALGLQGFQSVFASETKEYRLDLMRHNEPALLRPSKIPAIDALAYNSGQQNGPVRRDEYPASQQIAVNHETD